MAPEERRRRAIARALANGGAAAVRRVRFGLYKVASASRPGVTHRVRVIGANWFCTCEASLAGRPCWHQAAVYVAKLEHAMRGKGRVTGPAAPPTNVVAFRPRGGAPRAA
jgi:hypothetical protein